MLIFLILCFSIICSYKESVFSKLAFYKVFSFAYQSIAQRLKKEISETFDGRQVLTYRSRVEGVDHINNKVRRPYIFHFLQNFVMILKLDRLEKI